MVLPSASVEGNGHPLRSEYRTAMDCAKMSPVVVVVFN